MSLVFVFSRTQTLYVTLCVAAADSNNYYDPAADRDPRVIRRVSNSFSIRVLKTRFENWNPLNNFTGWVIISLISKLCSPIEICIVCFAILMYVDNRYCNVIVTVMVAWDRIVIASFSFCKYITPAISSGYIH
jgi:hypothetical protein